MTQIKDSTRNTRCRQTLRAGPVSSTQRKSPPEHKGGGQQQAHPSYGAQGSGDSQHVNQEMRGGKLSLGEKEITEEEMKKTVEKPKLSLKRCRNRDSRALLNTETERASLVGIKEI